MKYLVFHGASFLFLIFKSLSRTWWIVFLGLAAVCLQTQFHGLLGKFVVGWKVNELLEQGLVFQGLSICGSRATSLSPWALWPNSELHRVRFHLSSQPISLQVKYLLVNFSFCAYFVDDVNPLSTKTANSILLSLQSSFDENTHYVSTNRLALGGVPCVALDLLLNSTTSVPRSPRTALLFCDSWLLEENGSWGGLWASGTSSPRRVFRHSPLESSEASLDHGCAYKAEGNGVF